MVMELLRLYSGYDVQSRNDTNIYNLWIPIYKLLLVL